MQKSYKNRSSILRMITTKYKPDVNQLSRTEVINRYPNDRSILYPHSMGNTLCISTTDDDVKLLMLFVSTQWSLVE